jgi:putative aminopeptidase FrvX
MWDDDRLFEILEELVMHHSPSGAEAFPTQNTDGDEIAHLGAIANCIDLLKAFCETKFE